MTNAIEDYIKLAEGATEGPWKKGFRHDRVFIESDMPCGIVQKGDGSTFICSGTSDVITPNYNDAKFIAASRTLGPAMAKTLLEAEEALRKTKEKLLSHAHSEYDGVWNDADFLEETFEADQALAAIQRVKEGV